MQPSKNEILPYVTMWMELEGIMLSEISQSGKENYHMVSLIWGLWEARQRIIGKGRNNERRETQRGRQTIKDSISGSKLRVPGVEEGGKDGLTGWWTVGMVCAILSTLNCVRQLNHRPVPLKQIIHFRLRKNKWKIKLKQEKNKKIVIILSNITQI